MSESTESSRALAFELFLLSFTSLFFEMVVIRWLSCDFIAFLVFKTFPLVTCFVGLGVGVSKANDALFRMAAPALALFVIITYAMTLAGVGSIPFPAAGLYQWSDPSVDPMLWFNVFRMILAIVLLLAGPFGVMVCIGSRIGVLFNKQSPLSAYCIDIAGAIVGSLAFALSSFLGFTPFMQVAIVAALFAFFYTRQSIKAKWFELAPLIVCVLFAFIPASKEHITYWSPYTRIDVNELKIPSQLFKDPSFVGLESKQAKTENTVLVATLLKANHSFQQLFATSHKLELLPEALKIEAVSQLAQMIEVRKNYYGLPYKIISPKKVLVLGAGTGSDVREALANGAESVDAVEIDPRVAEIGRQYNEVYKSDKVNLIVDDGRNYVNRSSAKRYDLIVFACLDSMAFSGSGSSMRTDSYIHSKDSYQRCLKMLNPGGIFILAFGAPVSGNNEWLRDKMYKTLEAAAGYPPLVITDLDAPYKWPAYVFVSGDPVRSGQAKAPEIKDSFHPVTMPSEVQAKILTDDWPYLYIRPMGLDLSYLSVVLVVIGITTYAARNLIFAKNSAADGQFFALGAAFMLLELQAISRLSLLYGTTWVTTSVVINGVLLMILAANFVVVKFADKLKQSYLYAILAISLLASYFLPMDQMLALDEAGAYAGHLSITLISLAPVFVAGLLFATAFRRVSNAARSFAFNLLGSVAGALLEYFSTYWGIKSLLLIAFACYFASFLFYKSEKAENVNQA